PEVVNEQQARLDVVLIFDAIYCDGDLCHVVSPSPGNLGLRVNLGPAAALHQYRSEAAIRQ
ncbi:MAG TPA: hypothetical protein VGI00_01750, partial [Streptosporangiaceae bacterium]